jgi:hypothetical protein
MVTLREEILAVTDCEILYTGKSLLIFLKNLRTKNMIFRVPTDEAFVQELYDLAIEGYVESFRYHEKGKYAVSAGIYPRKHKVMSLRYKLTPLGVHKLNAILNRRNEVDENLAAYCKLYK